MLGVGGSNPSSATIKNFRMIRQAKFEDISEMVRIERLNFQERAFSRRQFRHYVQERSAYVVADNFVVFGYIVVFSRCNSRTARINVVSVDPNHTGKGYGSQLIEHVECVYGQTDDHMSLEVNSRNIGAIKLYERMGYMPKNLLLNYYGEGTTGIKMIKDLR